MVDFSQYAVGGATRPDSFSGMSPDFSAALGQLLQSAPKGYVQVSSGYRSPDRQAQLWSEAIKKYGNAKTARRWVAPPGRSKHNHGGAADLKFLNDTARQWVHQNASKFGLSFPLSNENWHVELAGSRGGHQHSAVASGSPAPSAPAPALADVAIPQQSAAPAIGNIVAQYMENRQRRDEAAAADRARKEALFGGSLADLYA